ncbi:MAG: hypothetical protein KKB74_06870 [Bacteroidetes bacterium]|nr:hypothetical protein [Bacteroidota bacterium]
MKTKRIKKGSLLKKMRKIRDKISLEIMNMSFEEEKSFLEKQLAALKK